MQEGLRELEILLDPYDWFYEVCAEARRYVVYVSYMDRSQDDIIPDWMHGKQVVVHFDRSKSVTKEQFFTPLEKKTYHQLNFLVDTSGSINDEDLDTCLSQLQDTDIDVPNIDSLCRELDRLEKQCGSNILQDIFYEIHDKNNAVTNFRSKFPDVHQGLLRLYNEYGFDTIYEELDG